MKSLVSLIGVKMIQQFAFLSLSLKRTLLLNMPRLAESTTTLPNGGKKKLIQSPTHPPRPCQSRTCIHISQCSVERGVPLKSTLNIMYWYLPQDKNQECFEPQMPCKVYPLMIDTWWYVRAFSAALLLLLLRRRFRLVSLRTYGAREYSKSVSHPQGPISD